MISPPHEYKDCLMTNHDRQPLNKSFDRQRYHAFPYQGETINPGLTEFMNGQNFAVHAGNGIMAIDLCIVDPSTLELTEEWSLNANPTPDGKTTFAGFIPELPPGSLYNLVTRSGHESAPEIQALVDPYARAFHQEEPHSQIYGVVVESSAEIKPGHVRIAPDDRVIYETHVKGATKLHPDIPEDLRGSYLGFSHPAHIKHLQDLGITTVELLPVMQFASEPHLRAMDKVNYWGYNPVSFFAPHAGYASSPEPGAAVGEFKQMVYELHEAGIEVVLDVVYNHTADGGLGSEPYSLRGLDTDLFHTYYDGERTNFHNFSGCGNTLNTSSPGGLQLTLDSLRYWVNEMGVDGFRFDLAASLIRNNDGQIDNNSPFFAAIYRDPALKDTLLIAEPWDLGNYPEKIFASRKEWLEWSGPYRDIVRDFWGIAPKHIGAIAHALCGPALGSGSLNFITAHDGFSMNDLVSYSHKHNEANGEYNRDGTDDNRSWNHGIEGDGIYNEYVFEARLKTIRNLFLTLLLSHGTPMIRAGDESLHTQRGNNNAYCQDNEITWSDWNRTLEQLKMISFVENVIQLRKNAHLSDPNATSSTLANSPIQEPSLAWLNVWGYPMEDKDVVGAPIFGRYTSGQVSKEPGDSLLYIINGTNNFHYASLPKPIGLAGEYELIANTATGEIDLEGLGRVSPTIAVQALSSVVLRRISSRLPESSVNVTPASAPYFPDARDLVGSLIS